MTLYDEYRRQYPITPEPSEFRDIIESEIKRVIAWMKAPPWPASVADWTEVDYEVAKEIMAPLSNMIVEYESLHYPIAEPSKEEAESFRREQEKPLPAEEIKPGRYIMTMPLRLAPCVQRPKEWKEAPECRDCDMRLCISTEEEIYGCLYSFIKQGAKFCRIEEEV